MASADGLTGARRRVLVVEDEYLIASDTAAMLEELGYEVLGPVPTVAEALAAIASEKLDAVLLDVNLGGTSSAPVATVLAERRVPFIVVTGYGSFTLATLALQDAPRLEKPIPRDDLAAILAKTIAL